MQLPLPRISPQKMVARVQESKRPSWQQPFYFNSTSTQREEPASGYSSKSSPSNSACGVPGEVPCSNLGSAWDQQLSGRLSSYEVHCTIYYCNRLYCTICVREQVPGNRGSLSRLSIAREQFNEEATLLSIFGVLIFSCFPRFPFAGSTSMSPVPHGHPAGCRAPQASPKERAAPTRVLHRDYLETDSRRFSCSMEGQAMIWTSSGPNSSFSRA